MSSQLCEQCHSKEKKIKILQADIDFEIKKMNEDLAQQKVLLELQYQKQNKKLIEKYNKEKNQRQLENKKWLLKYDKMAQQHQQTIEQLHTKYQSSSYHLKEQIQKQFNQKEEKRIEQHQYQVTSLKNQHQNLVTNLKEERTKEVNSLIRHQEEAIEQLQKMQKQKITSLVTEYELKVKELKREIAEVTQSRDTLQKEASKKQTSLYDELYQKRQEIANLSYQIDHLNNNIKNCEDQISLKKQEIEALKEKHEKHIRSIKLQFQDEKSKIIDEFNSQIESMLVNRLQEYKKFQQNVKEMEIKRTNEVKIYEDSLKQVKVLVQERPSRDQDIEKIRALKDMLNQKDKQYEKVLEVVKNYKLELDYKEQTFNRIFPANQNPLNIERIGLKKEKSGKGSQSHLKDTMITKYNTTKTIHTVQDFCKDRHRLTGATLKLF